MMSKGHIHSRPVNLKSVRSDLGLSRPEQPAHLVEEKVKMDRHFLEVMMTLKDGTVERAKDFFQRVMTETSTHISWPSRMKFRYKSRRDPYVTIAGTEEAVLSAKAKVGCMFDTWSNRVTLRITVSQTELRDIIGIGGHRIRSLSVETGCLIHFPDTNLKKDVKSNHICISGEIESVESCRKQIRQLTPVIFSFKVQAVESVLDPMIPFVHDVEDAYNVQVDLQPLFNPYFTQVLVKGSELKLRQVKEATMVLIREMSGRPAEQVPVCMSIEILPQHHSIVFGQHNEYLKNVKLQTETDIRYFEGTDPNIPPNMRGNVVVSGGIDNVYVARQQLIGRLPLCVLFVVQKESLAAKIDNIDNFANNLGVTIEMQHKTKSKNVVTVTMKGIEKNIRIIYEARQQLSGVRNAELLSKILVNNNVLNGNTVLTGKHPFREDHLLPLDSKHMILSQYCNSLMLDLGWNKDPKIDSPTLQVQPKSTVLCVPNSWTYYGFPPDSPVEEDKREWSTTSSSDISTDNPLTYAAVTKMRSTACSYSKAVGAERRKSLKPVRTESGSFE